MKAEHFFEARATAEIDTAALEENLRAVRRAHKGRVIAVVKADAYGHSLFLSVPAFLRAGCDFFAVATTEEALELRALAPKAQILLLGYTPPQDVPLLAGGGITQCVFSLPYAVALCAAAARAGVSLCVHIKVDAGMHRLGFPLDGVAQIQRVFALKSLTVTGLFTHFPSAAEHPRATKRALSRFAALRAKLPGELLVHAAAGTALGLSGAEFNAVRAGLSLYGYPTAPLPPLRPALRLFAPVVQIRTLPRGARVGYGGAFVTERRSRIGVLPIGYADGLCRAYEGMPVRLFHGEIAFPATLCGRICMDQCMVDLTDTPAEVGDRICLIEDAAKAGAYRGSIPYEVLCAIGKRVWRREKGEDVDRILRNP